MRLKDSFLRMQISRKLLSILTSVCMLEGEAEFFFSANLTVANFFFVCFSSTISSPLTLVEVEGGGFSAP